MNSRDVPLSPREQTAQHIAEVAYRLLRNQQLLLRQPAFEVLPLGRRVILVFDPLALNKPEAVVADRFVHRLSTALGGRQVVPTNSRGLFLQVAYAPPPALPRLESQVLPLEDQPSPQHVPRGLTRRGKALWLPLPAMDSVLIGGSRRMGKTNLLHTWIQALLHSGAARLFLWDGKGGVEFARYQVAATVQDDLAGLLATLHRELLRRQTLLRQSGRKSVAEYNAHTHVPLPLLVPVVDELAQVGNAEQDALARLVALGGAFGIHPVIATQRPDAKAVQGLLKSNLSTRIALPVPSHHESHIILGRSGAEGLPRVPGRLMLVWNARLVEAQAFLALEDFPAQTRPPAQTALLTPWETEVVRVAVQELGGWFRIRELAQRTDVSRDRINALAKRWEAMGYLTPVRRDAQGHPVGREVRLTLVEAAGLGGLADLADQADWADLAPEAV
jgi:hypothetical protein